MDKYQVNVPTGIYDQLSEIRSYISDNLQSPDAADKAVREIIEGMRSLEVFPERGFNADERYEKKLNPNAITRGLPLKKDYIVLYDVDVENKIVHVRYLLPTKSDYMKLFR